MFQNSYEICFWSNVLIGALYAKNLITNFTIFNGLNMAEKRSENLIVLCPNCHTRVHREGVPSDKQLHQYKLKEEVVYGFPVVGRLSPEEKRFVSTVSKEPEDEMV